MRKPRCLSRVLAAAAAIAFLGAPAEAYYHYVYFNGRSTPFSPINAHYDLTKLVDNTVVFCVYGAGPTDFYSNDSFGSVLAGIKQAIGSWNAVPNSALHVAFGGLEYAGQNANTPGGDVVFEDLPPGLLGVASPNLPTAPQFSTTAAGVPFVPISRSTVYLTSNTAILPGPSYLEMFFTTAVHEFGHALGLQHTWTGSAMSQDVIRNTSRARPLDADDIAGFLELYGASGWTSNYGSISGTVSPHGAGSKRVDQPRWDLHHQRPAAQQLPALRSPASSGRHRVGRYGAVAAHGPVGRTVHRRQDLPHGVLSQYARLDSGDAVDRLWRHES
jgi:hypothetical protein